MKALAACANGDGRQIHPPSKVLCLECFTALWVKFRALGDALGKESETGGAGLGAVKTRVARISFYGSRQWAIVDEHGDHIEVRVTVDHPQFGRVETGRIYYRLKRDAVAATTKWAQDRAGTEPSAEERAAALREAMEVKGMCESGSCGPCDRLRALVAEAAAAAS